MQQIEDHRVRVLLARLVRGRFGVRVRVRVRVRVKARATVRVGARVRARRRDLREMAVVGRDEEVGLGQKVQRAAVDTEAVRRDADLVRVRARVRVRVRSRAARCRPG